MRLEVFTVYDAAVKAYLPPFYCRSTGEALRSFGEAVNNREHGFNKHMADYTLFRLGVFDDGGATFEVGIPHRVISALEMATPADQPAGRQLELPVAPSAHAGNGV